MKKQFYVSAVLFLCLLAVFCGSCSKAGNDDRNDPASFLYGTWKWDGQNDEITFLEAGKALWNYNDERGTKETLYTYDSSTAIIHFTQYREKYQVLKVESAKIQLLSLWDNKEELWIRIVK